MNRPLIEAESAAMKPDFLWWERIVVTGLCVFPGARPSRLSKRVRQAVHGGAWTVTGYGAGQVLRLVTQLLLAHILLTPSAFGLVALVNVFLSGLEMLSDLGIGMDVIQHPRGDDPVFMNTAFVIQMVRGFVLFVVAAVFAYPFARFYLQPAVRGLVIFAALSIGIRGLASSSVWTMGRHLEFRRLTGLSVSAEVVGVIASLLWVYISPSAWALVGGRVASAAAFVVGSHLISKNRITLQWDRGAARDILIFGTGIFVSSATYFISGEAERLVVGKFITVAELGCFSLALSLASAPSQAISQVVGQVFYPMISNSIREDQVTATQHFKKARAVFLAVSIVLGVGFIAYGPRVVATLLPPKFSMAGWMLQILGFRAAQQVFVAPTSSLIFAYGNSKYAAVANGVRMALMGGGLWIAFSRFGIHLAISVLAFSSALGYFVLIPGIARYQPKSLWFELRSALLFLLCMGLAAVLRFPWESLR